MVLYKKDGVNIMKKLFLIVCFMFAFLLAGCSSGVLEYRIDLGYDNNDIDSQMIVFHIYQANMENHHWHKLTTIEYKPQTNKHFDVDYDIQDNEVIFYVREKEMTEKKDTIVYDANDVGSYRLPLAGVQQLSAGYKTFEIKDNAQEQFLRLYAFSEQGTTYYQQLSLDQPYDEENLNTDNILVTITLKK